MASHNVQTGTERTEPGACVAGTGTELWLFRGPRCSFKLTTLQERGCLGGGGKGESKGGGEEVNSHNRGQSASWKFQRGALPWGEPALGL